MTGKIQILLASLLGVLLFGGCNVGPKYARPLTPIPPAFKETNGWKLAQPKDSAIRGKWWEMFNDPQLNALENQVTISNQNIRAASANFLAARAVVKQARSQYFPTVTLNPSVTTSRLSSRNQVVSPSTVGNPIGASSSNSAGTVSGTFSTYSLPLGASWSPDLWGGVRNTVKEYTFAAQATAAELENVRLTNHAELAVDYYELRSEDSLKELLDATVTAYQKTLDLTKTLYETGIDSAQDVAQAETQLATVMAQDIAVGIQRAAYEHAIALLTGQPASAFSIPAEPLKANPPAIPVGVPSQLLERRPDIAAAERSVAEANAVIGVAKAAYFPTLTLSGSTGFQSSSLGSLLSGPGFFWSVGGNLAETLFDAGRRAAVAEQARATYAETVANYRQTVLAAFQGVEDNLATLRVLSEELRQQEVAVEYAKNYLALATHRYEAGIDSYLNVITAQTTLLANQQTELNLRMQQMTASVQLIVALGGGWDVSQLPPPPELISKTPPNP